CVAFGLAPALHATRTDVSAVLKSGDHDSRRKGRGFSLRETLLAIQVAISLLLLVDAGLVIRGMQKGRAQDLGFKSRGVVTMEFGLPASFDPAQTASFTRAIMDAGRAANGESITFASSAPLGYQNAAVSRFTLPGEPVLL